MCVAVHIDVEWRLLVSGGVWWCLWVSYNVRSCEEIVKSFSKRIQALFMDVCMVLVLLRMYLSFQAFYGAANAIYLNFWIAPTRKIRHTWHLSNIKIPKTPYISSKKALVLCKFWIFLVPQKKNTIDSLSWSPCSHRFQIIVLIRWLNFLDVDLPSFEMMISYVSIS